ncbi:MAG: hypothetical protein ACFFC0_07865 [Promethearchaeota archaeon]
MSTQAKLGLLILVRFQFELLKPREGLLNSSEKSNSPMLSEMPSRLSAAVLPKLKDGVVESGLVSKAGVLVRKRTAIANNTSLLKFESP